MPGLRSCRGFSLVVASGGYSLVAVRGLLITVASHCRAWALGSFSICSSRALEQRLISCGLRALLLCGIWDLPRPVIKPMFPALAGRFFTTEFPGRP